MSKPYVADLDFVKLDPPEISRTYHFKGQEITFLGVEEIAVTKSGSHRLNMKCGTKAIVPKGWLAISFTAADWTF